MFMQYFITADQRRRKRKVFIALIISLSESDGVMDKTDRQRSERRSRLSWTIKLLNGNRVALQSGSLFSFIGVKAELWGKFCPTS